MILITRRALLYRVVYSYISLVRLYVCWAGELGRLYTLGHGREVDFNLALKHLQKGAEALDRCVYVLVCLCIYVYMYVCVEV